MEEPVTRLADSTSSHYRYRYAIGTRAIVQRKPGDYRVVCASCDAGGTVHHTTQRRAFRAAARDSARACRACGLR